MEKQKNKLHEVISDYMQSSKPVKIAIYLLLGITGVYMAGSIFKIFANTIREFKDLSSAIKR